MKKYIIALVLVATLPAFALAKKPQKAAEPAQAALVVEEAEPTVTEECVINVSLFNESVKNKQYADAWDPWWQVYTTCPNANKAIYTRGDELVEWKISQTQDPKEYDELRQLLLKLHDSRIKYFGDDPKYPKAYILGLKGVDYCNFYKEDPLKDPAYEWLKESIEGMREKSQIQVLKQFADLSNARYKLDPEKYGAAYIADYQAVSMILAAQASDPKNKNAMRAQENKDYVDQMFASSGAADCDKLDEIFGPIVSENISNLDILNKIMGMYRRVKCTESEIYFTAAAAVHKLEPTEESAAGCAKMCMKKGEYKDAVNYYEQAIELAPEDDKEDRAEYLFNIAYIYFDKIKSYQLSRNYLRRSLELQANQGRCYILMGMLYAASKPYGEGMAAAKAAILNKTVFWAAVDKFQKAKMVDPDVADDANKLIASYSKYFPTKEEIFDLPELQDGASFTVGGWIQETTTCRAAK
ncbi:MAG: tetratricopeptide repeat protein [Paludibacteraceae bacterium]|nr:tetratricopeptide repeat protein [Paludibacteraceae bacterium]